LIAVWNNLAALETALNKLRPVAWEAVKDAAKVAEQTAQAALLRDIAGPLLFRKVSLDPAWLVWNHRTIVRLAASIYEERAFQRMPILADAVEEAGCRDEEILCHCRGPGPHARGCWLVDLLLGRE
jgi:hypothetical protein